MQRYVKIRKEFAISTYWQQQANGNTASTKPNIQGGKGQRSNTVAQHQIRVGGQGTGCLALFVAAAPDIETHGFRSNS